MELIKRLVRWTPANIGLAFLLSVFISTLLIVLPVYLVIASAYDVMTWGLLVPVVFNTLLLAPLVGAFLGLFGLFPALLLKRWYRASWTWLVAGGWCGIAAVAVAMLFSSSERATSAFLFVFALGALSGVVWWHFARNLIRRDIELTDTSCSDSKEP